MISLGSFQKNVVIGASVTLVVLLAIIGYLLENSTELKETWPPTIGVCPDYWEDTTGTGKQCRNIHGLGQCKVPEQGVDLTWMQNPKERCNAKELLTDCSITWDGITNDENACVKAKTAPDDSKSLFSSSNINYFMIFLGICLIGLFIYLGRKNQ